MRYAIALYTNVAECSDELSFSEGDLLQIIEKDYDENEGWWKCSLGKLEGLVPANYLEELSDKHEHENVYNLPRQNGLITDVYDELPSRRHEEEYDILPIRSTNEVYDELPKRTNDVYDLPKEIKLRHPEKLLNLRKKHNDLDDYDILPRKSPTEDTYDLPKLNRTNSNNNNRWVDEIDGVYDLPRKMSPKIEEDYDLPKVSNKIGQRPESYEDYDDLPSLRSKESSVRHMKTNSTDSKDSLSSDMKYNNGGVRELSKLSLGHSRSSIASSTASSDSFSIGSFQIEGSPLSIDTESAMEKLLALKDSVDSSASKLLSLFTPSWRKFCTETVLIDKTALIKSHGNMRQSIENFIDFARASLATAASNGYKKSISTISKRLQPIEEDYTHIIRRKDIYRQMVWLILTQILVETQNKLRESQWNLTVLIDKDKREGVPDDFDCFVMTTRAIPDDVAELASYIYTHSQNIFRKKSSTSASLSNLNGYSETSDLYTKNERRNDHSKVTEQILDPTARPLPNTPFENRNNNEDIDHDINDYDYVSFEEIKPRNSSNKKDHQFNRMSSFKEIPPNTINDPARERLSSFYSQFGKSQLLLQQDMDMFIVTIHDKPPIKFVTLSKRILKRSQELVFIGDAACKVLQSCGRNHMKLEETSNNLSRQSILAAKQVTKAAKMWPAEVELDTALELTAAIGEHVRSLKHSIHNAIITQ